MKYILDDKKIVKFLCDNNLPQRNFAKQLNMSPATLDIVIGGQPVTLQTVKKIADAIGYQVDSLILGPVSTKKVVSDK